MGALDDSALVALVVEEEEGGAVAVLGCAGGDDCGCSGVDVDVGDEAAVVGVVEDDGDDAGGGDGGFRSRHHLEEVEGAVHGALHGVVSIRSHDDVVVVAAVVVGC